MTPMNFLGLELLDFPLKNQLFVKNTLTIGKKGRKRGFQPRGFFRNPKNLRLQESRPARVVLQIKL